MAPSPPLSAPLASAARSTRQPELLHRRRFSPSLLRSSSIVRLLVITGRRSAFRRQSRRKQLTILFENAIPLLVETPRSNQTQAKQVSLRALYNLSFSPSNIAAMAETDLIPFLFTKIGDMDISERILSILNLASASEGRKRISQVGDAFPILMNVFNWIDSPIGQEKSSYILMVMAHKSYVDLDAAAVIVNPDVVESRRG